MQGAAKRRILEVFKRAATPQTGQNPPERRRGDFCHGLLASYCSGWAMSATSLRVVRGDKGSLRAAGIRPLARPATRRMLAA